MNTTQAHVDTRRDSPWVKVQKLIFVYQEKLCDDLDPEPENTNFHDNYHQQCGGGKARVMFRGPLVELALQSEV